MPIPLEASFAALCLTALTSLATAQEVRVTEAPGPELAGLFVEVLELELSGLDEDDLSAEELAEVEAMFARIEELVGELSDWERELFEEEGLQSLYEPLLEEFRPDALPLFERYRERGRISTTHHYLETLQAALEMYLSFHAEHPPVEAGLASLVAEGLLDFEFLVDGWGRVFLYQRADASDYRVVSMGADGRRGTADDWVLTVEEGLRLPSEPEAPDARGSDRTPSASPRPSGAPLVREHAGDLQPGETLAGLLFGGGLERDVVLVESEDGSRLLRGGREQVRLGVDDEVLAVSDQGTICYLTEQASETVLVCGDWRVPVPGGWASARFLTGTETLIYEDGDRTTCLNTGGEVLGEPATGPWGDLAAFRERRGDSEYFVHDAHGIHGPATWASAPRAHPVFEEGGDRRAVVTFRLWDGTGTRVHVDEEVWSCTWAGPVQVSDDGEHAAVLANFGGTPGADFETEREHLPNPWLAARGVTSTPAHELFEGGAFGAILDGEPSAEFLAVSDLVLKTGGIYGAALYRARTAERWQVTYQNAKLEGPTVVGKEVGPPLVDGSGLWSCYDYRSHGGRRWLEAVQIRHQTGKVYSRHAGPDAAFLYATEDNTLEQGRTLSWFTPSTDEGGGVGTLKTSEPVQGHELVGWVGSPSRPVVDVYSEGKAGLYYGYGTLLAFEPDYDDGMPAVLPPSDAAVPRVAQVTRFGANLALVVHHLDEEHVAAQTLDGRIAGADRPMPLSDGRVLFVAHLDTESQPYLRYGSLEGGVSALVIYDDEVWRSCSEADRISNLQVSEGGRVAWIATYGEQERVEVLDGENVTDSGLLDSVDDLELEFFGEQLVFVIDEPRTRVVVDMEAGPEADAVYYLAPLADGTVTYGYSADDRSYTRIGDESVGPFDSVWKGSPHADLELFSFTTNDESFTSTELVVVSTRAGERGRVLFRQRYDALEEDYTNDDRDRLVYYAAAEGRLERIVLDLASLRAEG